MPENVTCPTCGVQFTTRHVCNTATALAHLGDRLARAAQVLDEARSGLVSARHMLDRAETLVVERQRQFDELVVRHADMARMMSRNSIDVDVQDVQSAPTLMQERKVIA